MSSIYVILQIFDLINASTQNTGKIMCCARITVFIHTQTCSGYCHICTHTLCLESLKIINRSWGLGHLMHSLHIKLVRYPLQLLYFLPSAEKMHFLMKWNITVTYHRPFQKFSRGDSITLELRPSITCPPMWRTFSRLRNNSNEPWKNTYTPILFTA